MTDVWSQRAELYVQSDAHREGDDLELLVDWARGAKTALDVATGGGHVARRLRDEGLEVVTCDPAPGMRPDVVCRAEELPFRDASFDVVACRTAAHHFGDVRAALSEMARVSAGVVLIADTLYMGEGAEEAERLRDHSHVQTYRESEWRELLEGAGLELREVRIVQNSFDFADWLQRTGCEGGVAERVHELLGERVSDGRLTLDKIVLRAGRR
jgi:SAM-dependent methyltransferase